MLFVAGGTGFVGKHLLEFLKEEGVHVRCLVRGEKKGEWVRGLGFEAVEGDLSDPESLRNRLDGVETVIHLVGIIEERGSSTFEAVHVQGTENLVNEAIAAGARRFFYQSALGADLDASYPYLKSKARAEQIVISSGLSYDIFRPSLIVGRGDGFTERMKQLVSFGPVVPVPGDGKARFQPLYIRDWLKCIAPVLKGEIAPDRTHEIGGPDQLSYNEILQDILEVLGMKKKIVHMPMELMRLSLPFLGVAQSAASLFGRAIPSVSSDLLSLLSRDNICDADVIKKDFGFVPMRFADALKEFL
jgi:uncharacterized protein YbjT (DUF2867 family)